MPEEKMKHNNNNKNKGNLKVAFHTLGCKVNQTESEALSQLFTDKGYSIVLESDNPDVIIVNTCTVTGTGSSKSRKLIRRMAKDHPSSTIAVIGCYSQIQPDEVAALEGVDLIMGTQDRITIFNHLQEIQEEKQIRQEYLGDDKNREQEAKEERKEQEQQGYNKRVPIRAVREFEKEAVYEELPLVKSESRVRVRVMLKIQDGCSQFCTYCIVPYARGPSRSRSPERVLEEAHRLLAAGYKEIVLTGVHIGRYGHDLSKENIDLVKLIRLLVQLPGMNRLRLGSIEPMEFTEELLEVIAGNEAICPHFHIPLQSGSDHILARMKRPYTTAEYARLLQRIREKIPQAALAADIMTGFPGETKQEHQEGLAFIERCALADIHAFPYSRRPGTPAADMPDQIPNQVKAARVKELLELGGKGRIQYFEHFIGKTLELLIERVEADGTIQGHTRNYIELRIPAEQASHYQQKWQPGGLLKCLVREEFLIP